MNRLRKLWYARLRNIDLQILWPICKQQADDLNEAKAIFCFHAMNDRAWVILGEAEVVRLIDTFN